MVYFGLLPSSFCFGYCCDWAMMTSLRQSFFMGARNLVLEECSEERWWAQPDQSSSSSAPPQLRKALPLVDGGRCSPTSMPARQIYFCEDIEVGIRSMPLKCLMKSFQSLYCPTFKDIVRTNESSQQYSEACIQICKEMKVKVIDLWNAFQKRDDWADAYLSCDGVHLSADGSKFVFDEIMEVLKDTELDPPLRSDLLQDDFAEEKPYDFDALKKWCLNAYSTD